MTGAGLATTKALVVRCRRVNPASTRRAVAHLRRSDPVLRQIVDTVGPPRMQYREPTFASLARAIVFQQLNGAVARVILTRLEGEMPGGRLSPEAIASTNTIRLRRLGLSRQKASYLKDLARRTIRDEVRFDRLAAMPDDEVIAHLTAVKGIGPWTAQMFLMFALRRPDVLPTGDLGIRLAIRRAYRLRDLPSSKKMQTLARPWRPYCSLASWYFWRSLEDVSPRARP